MRAFEQPTLFGGESTKRCGMCGEIKPLTDFHLRTASHDGRQRRCKRCNIEGAMEYFLDNADYCRQRIGDWARRIDSRNKQRVFDYLCAHPCVDCGESDPVVLEFDHRRDKASGVAELLHTHVRWAVIAAEIEKCEVRCANCHRRRTAVEGNWFRTRASESAPAQG